MADDKNAALIAEAREQVRCIGHRIESASCGHGESILEDLADALEAAEAKIARVEAKCAEMDATEGEGRMVARAIASEFRAALNGEAHG